MELKPGYKLTEVGVIPEGWEVVPLGSCFNFRNGLNKGKRFFGLGTPIVNYMDVFTRPGLRVQDIRGQVDVDSRELRAYEVRSGDVLFTRTSETVDEIGIAAVVLDELKDTVFSGFVLRARPTNLSLDDHFKAYCFAAPYFRHQVTARASYTTRALTNGRSLSAALLVRPPLPEQRAIAAALNDADQLLESLAHLIAKKRDITEASMQQLLTGQMRLPGFEGEWELRRLNHHVRFLKNGVQSRAELTGDGSVRYLHYGDVHTTEQVRLNPEVTSMPSIPKERAKTLDRLRDGDLVFVDASEDLSGVGKSLEISGVSSVEVVAGQHTVAARFDKSILADGFKAYLQFVPTFRAHLRRLAAGTKVYATTRAHIASAEIRLPSVEEQVAIASVLSDMEVELAALEARRAKTQTIKQAMMQELLTGKTRLVPAGDAHD